MALFYILSIADIWVEQGDSEIIPRLFINPKASQYVLYALEYRFFTFFSNSYCKFSDLNADIMILNLR